jgi:invasion protein IalB
MRLTALVGMLGLVAVVALITAAIGVQELANAQTHTTTTPVLAHRAGTEAKRNERTEVAAGQPEPVRPAPSAWVSRCASTTRHSVPECFIEQTAVLAKTGQLVVSMTVRLPPTIGRPVMVLQVPVGLYLPAGITFKIDDGAPTRLVVQTCDMKGCYAGDQIAPQLLQTMKSGKQFAVGFQNLTKQNITVPLTLTQFAEAYQSIQ